MRTRTKIVTLLATCFTVALSVHAIAADGQAALQRVNELRAKHGLPTLELNEQLQADATSWSKTMQTTRTFRHGRGSYLGECIAISNSADGAANAWYRSSGHRAIILSRNASNIGVANAGNYWTLRTGGNVTTSSNIEVDDDGTWKKSKTWQRQGRAKPVRYLLWRLFR